MTQQPFDPLDTLLHEALDSDALPPADLTDRIMARVAETPQQKPTPSHKRRLGWLAAAAACVAIVGAALPMVLRGAGEDALDAAAGDNAAPPTAEQFTSGASSDGSSDRLDTGDTNTAEASRKEQPSLADGTDALSAALSAAGEVLYYQGYALHVTARTENAVQAGLVDGSGDPVDSGDILDNAMTAAGFTYADGWYILQSEETTP